ncbi:MAG: DUF2202 domain-containing protein [Planctomycetaceae bacterium]|nr:DUF2202 domain-containing protein [Planctomycetales bacterium]MCB9925442.1 DUF2202 domain-containing protein [Planctomycetaceae bacterium]
MRKVITVALVLLIVVSTSVGWAQQLRGGRGQSNQQSRGIQGRSGNQQFQSQGIANLQRGPGCCGRQGQGIGGFTTGTLSSVESQGLTYMRQEEKLARDVYLTLGEQWNLPIFANIAKAESRHMAAIGGLLARYNLADPVAIDVRGQFTDQKFTKMYEDLVASGAQSLADALRVGIQIEELDIADLQADLNTARQQDIRNVYQNLLKGSQQHLRAFTAQLK